MGKKAVSLKDFSEALGISVSTVSRALKNHPDISLEVKKKVHEMAKTLNYQVSASGVGFRNASTKTIGVIVPNMERYFYASVISGIEAFARKKGYFIVIANSQESYQREIECVENMVRLNVDGLIMCLTEETLDYSHFDKVRPKELPLVFFDRVCRTNEFSSVIADNAEAAKAITCHLADSGSQRIAHIAGPRQLNITRERVAGYLMALNDKGLEFDKDLLIHTGMKPENVIEAVNRLLKLSKRPDAIFCVNDTAAYVTMKVLRDNGLRIPQDIAVTGFNDEFHSSVVAPALTTVAHPAYEMGQETA